MEASYITSSVNGHEMTVLNKAASALAARCCLLVVERSSKAAVQQISLSVRNIETLQIRSR